MYIDIVLSPNAAAHWPEGTRALAVHVQLLVSL